MNTDPIVTAWAQALREGGYEVSTRSSIVDSTGRLGIYGVLCKVVGIQEIGQTAARGAPCPSNVRKMISRSDRMLHLDVPPGLQFQRARGLYTIRDTGCTGYTNSDHGAPLTHAQFADLLDYFGIRQD